MKPIFKAVPEAVESTSRDLAASLGLPWRGPGMPRLVIGRREWIALPDLGVSPLNAKTDSGARSSSIHAEDVVLSADEKCVRFTTTNHYNEVVACESPVARIARVKSSSGKAKKRIFIETTAVLARRIPLENPDQSGESLGNALPDAAGPPRAVRLFPD